MRFYLQCVPPSTTAQQKRLAVIHGKPRFFHSQKLKNEEETWGWLMAKHVPPAPLVGALTLTVRFVYPHNKRTSQKNQGLWFPKITRPDAGNIAKHLEDTLVRLRFVEDDAQFARVTFEKWHGPTIGVGIYINITEGVTHEQWAD